MIDFDPATACRICLEDGATCPIFERNEDAETSECMHAKLTRCLKEKIENIEGYPCNICLKCKNTIDTICSFLNKFEETCKILQSKIVTVKTELIDSNEINDDDDDDDDNNRDTFQYELQIENVSNVKPKVEKRDPTELLESLTHLTVKRIKIKNDSESQDSSCGESTEVKERKPGSQPKVSKAKAKKISKNDSESQDSSCGESTEVKEKKPSRQTKVSKAKAKKISNKAGTKKIVNQARKQPISGSSKSTTVAVTKEANRMVNLKLVRQEIKTEKNNKTDLEVLKLCDLCGATFNTPLKLNQHMRTVHSERRFKCTKCSKTYKKENELNDHVLKQHEKVKNFICDKCGKSFLSKKTVASHIAVVHNKKKYNRNAHYKCKYCERSYTYKRGIVIHERSVHTGERPSVCGVCGSSFYDHVYLAEHMRIHTGDTPFKCPVCGRGYTQRGNMKSHMRNHKISELDSDTLSKLKPNYFKFMRP